MEESAQPANRVLPCEGSDSTEHDVVTDYLQSEMTSRRQGLRRAGLVVGLGGLASLALGSQMTDIGHAVGFFGLGLALVAGAVFIARA